MQRREFIHKLTRTGILLALLAIVSGMVFKRIASGEDLCEENEFCTKCTKFSNCNLPKAEKERTHERN
ncbi:MAG: hypothetical protein K9H64_16230 [Bacteroidales bacterium]|nr:hypothetical protein [Bacteroidales bacterium]MCF8457517.1 hypothetical protein [Bacteroidales bacterium]